MSQNLPIVFRCDAGEGFGSGHLLRCLTLATEFGHKGYKVVFICNKHAGQMIDALAQGRIEHYADQEYQGEALLLVVDHYGLDKDYQNGCRSWAQHIMSIEDTLGRQHDSDILLDTTPLRSDTAYETLTPNNVQLLLGVRYALMKEGFRNTRQKANQRLKNVDDVERVFVTCGSMDGKQVLPKVIGLLQSINSDLQLDVMLSSKAISIEEVKQLAEDNQNITLHIDVASPEAIMQDADMAISAAGLTAIELCTVAIPTLLVITADNQIDNANGLEEMGCAKLLCDWQRLEGEAIEKHINNFVADSKLRHTLSARCYDMFDAMGARRVAQEVLSIINK